MDVKILLSVKGLNVMWLHVAVGGLEQKVRALYDAISRLEEEKYDWEFKLRKMDFEVSYADYFLLLPNV